MSAHRSEAIRNNRAVYDAMAAAGDPLCRVAKDEDLVDPLPRVDPLGWLGGSVEGQRLLCLAAGGGRQSSIYAAAGAQVTVVDVSPAMLELDRAAAAQRHHSIRVVETSMDDLSMFGAGEFDVVIHPVSSCYLPDVAAVYRQVARVIRPGGVYVSQHKTPTSLQTSTDRVADGRYQIEHAYYRNSPIPPPHSESPATRRLREHGATEYLHRWEQLIGGMCRSGFVIEDLVEPKHAESSAAAGTFADRAGFVTPYVRIKARRVGSTAEESTAAIWIPS